MDLKPGETVWVTYPGCEVVHKQGTIQYLCSDAYEQVVGWKKNIFRYCVRFDDGTLDRYVVAAWINRRKVGY